MLTDFLVKSYNTSRGRGPSWTLINIERETRGAEALQSCGSEVSMMVEPGDMNPGERGSDSCEAKGRGLENKLYQA